jgi:hypothetical protein
MYFVICPMEPADWQHAMFILSYYHKLEISLFSDGSNAESAYMVVESKPLLEGDENELRLAEMAFQGDWHQHNEKLCPHCIDHADHYDSCGHLAFSKPINPAF